MLQQSSEDPKAIHPRFHFSRSRPLFEIAGGATFTGTVSALRSFTSTLLLMFFTARQPHTQTREAQLERGDSPTEQFFQTRTNTTPGFNSIFAWGIFVTKNPFSPGVSSNLCWANLSAVCSLPEGRSKLSTRRLLACRQSLSTREVEGGI